MSEAPVRRVPVNGIEVDVHEAGDRANPTVLLCHGFPEMGWSWRHQLPVLADAGYHVLAPDQRGYGRSSAPPDVAAYGITQLVGDLTGLLDHYGKRDAVWVGHDWGALIVWDAARLVPERMRAVVGVSVPFVQWPMLPTELMKMGYGDRFFYILYFQQVGPPERELEADVRATMAAVLYGASAAAASGREAPAPADLPPMEGTGFLSAMPDVPALPFTGPEGPWLTAADLEAYVDGFTASGFFGPVSYYRNLDANYALVGNRGAEHVTMPVWFIGGEHDVVTTMDPTGVERMAGALPNYRGHTIIPGVGHWTQQEAPAAFNRALLAALSELDA